MHDERIGEIEFIKWSHPYSCIHDNSLTGASEPLENTFVGCGCPEVANVEITLEIGLPGCVTDYTNNLTSISFILMQNMVDVLGFTLEQQAYSDVVKTYDKVSNRNLFFEVLTFELTSVII